jgi:transcriptional regulator with XRE-family HTH domain
MKREFSEKYRKRLVAVRERLGLSRGEIAERMLTPVNTYRQWEAGSRSVPGVAVVAAESLRESKPAVKKPAARVAKAPARKPRKVASRRAARKPRRP